MKNNIIVEEKISKIKNDHYEILSIVSDSIKNNGQIVQKDIKDIIETINFDEKCVKRYTAIVKAQELIASLTTDITLAKTPEEIIAIRKKINYYINKIKSELKKRNVSETELNKYQESVNYLRHDISKYIRILKRENNIAELNNLNENFDSLGEEEKEKLNKLLKNEIRYNHRILNPQPETKKVKSTKPKKKEISDTFSEISQEDVDLPITENSSNQSTLIDEDTLNTIIRVVESVTNASNEDVDLPIPENSSNQSTLTDEATPSNTMRVVESIDDVNSEDIDYLDTKIKTYAHKYGIQIPYSYDKQFLPRAKSMIRNIPLYKKNQKRIKNMQNDSRKYYSGGDFVGYIAYLTKVNSIKHGLKSVFNHSYLYSEETKLLNDHEKCAEWLLNYCKENSLAVNTLNRKRVIS